MVRNYVPLGHRKLPRRPNPKSSDREVIRCAFASVWGSLGTRRTGLTGHISIANNMRTHLTNFDNFHEEVQETFLSYLFSRCENGNHQHLPNVCAPILGVQTIASGAIPMAGIPPAEDNGLYLEAWWTVNPFLPTDDNFPETYWAMDLMPACPLYQAIKYSLGDDGYEIRDSALCRLYFEG